ncbi:MAG: response regulator transcription factor [Spirosomataceae bacterium]
MPIHVLLADDHKIFADSLSLLLSNIEGIIVVGHATDGRQALNFLEQHEVDIVLSDLHMPQMNGVEMALHIRLRFPQTKVLMLTMAEDAPHIREALQAGVTGYVLKSAGKEELEKALRTVAMGHRYLSEMALRELYRQAIPADEGPELLHSLTSREIEILRLIAQEYSSTQIADKLFISLNTVESHRKNLFKKLNAKNSLGLIKFALKNGLVD